MSLQTIEVNPGPAPLATIVILHGLGADGSDFLSFVDELKLARVGPVRYVFPRAPIRPVTINGGHAMRAWYDILNMDLARREDEPSLREAFAQVHALLDAEVARGMPAHRIVLGGFSQGCAVTFGAGLRYGQRLAGLLGLSGYLPLSPTLAAERHAANAATPVFQAHGRSDGVIAIDRAIATRDQLQGQGQPLEWHEYPMEHSVCREEVQHIQAFVLRVLAAA
jgi:phospholipase/carboxylesterase